MAASTIRLTVILGPDSGASITFDGDRLVIGRGDSCDLVLNDSTASRKHAAIERTAEGFSLVDLGSNNGTFVEGEKSKITKYPLRTGVVMVIGRTKIKVEMAGGAPAVVDGDATIVDRAAIRPAAQPLPPAARPTASGEPARGAPLPAGSSQPPSQGVGAQLPSDLPIVLTVISGPDRGMVYSPSKDAISIGRLTTCDVPISDPAASRIHATIKRESSGYVVYDENSRNGTEVGNPPRPAFHETLLQGDTIRIGESEIRVDIGTGKGTEDDTGEKTMLFGSIGEKTFQMSIRGLGSRSQPHRQIDESSETIVVRRDAKGGRGGPPAGGGEPPGPPPPPPSPPPKIVLKATSGPSAGQSYEPKPGVTRFTVGRAEGADWIVPDPGISSLHFSINVTGGDFVLKDEGSRNGTFLDGKPERVTTALLKGGEKIRAGSTDFAVEVTGARPAAAPAGEGTLVMATPPPAAPKPAAAAAKPAAAPAGKQKPQDLVPELARSAAAKERISKIMKGVSLRPMRVPGTTRQWASLGAILAAVVISWALPRSWLSAGPVHQDHAEIEAACETCHTAGVSVQFLNIAGPGTTHAAMNGGCITADCHAKVLKTKPEIRDDCLSCHTDHRGRTFNIKGGEQLCWSCHQGREEPRDFGTRLMQVSLTRDPDLKTRLQASLKPTEIGLRFSHEAHDKETAGDSKYETCVGCHPAVEKGRTFALPGHAECIDCHEKAVSADVKVAAEKKGPDCLECHTREDGEMADVPKRPGTFAYVVFSHQDHLVPNAECKSCHAEIWSEGEYKKVVRTKELYPVTMDACYTCHQQKTATVACLDCHREHHSFPVEAGVPPARAAGGFDFFMLGMLALAVGALGYTWIDVRMVRRYLEPPPPPAAASGPGGAPGPAGGGGGEKAAPVGEIMPFPKVDIEACISCSSCYNSCPKQVLAGDDHGKSVVVKPEACIALEGCAVCEQGCPTGAIRVSTAPLIRTVERPEIDEHNEAKIPGIFFAGEVIGAALIKSAINQGFDDVKYIAEKKPKVADAQYDVIVAGAGPAGLGAALESKRRNLRYLVLERDTVASTIRNYPRDKAVLAEPIKMPLYGQLPMVDADKDTLMAMWAAIVKTTGLHVNEYEEVTDVKRNGGVLEVTTTKGKYTAANVILAIGTRGNPRKLGCPGEDPSCVSYNLIDAGEWTGKSVIVVGGGDSAIEAAVALGQAGAKTILSYRRGEFARVKKRNLENLDEGSKAGKVELILNSTLQQVSPGKVVIKTATETREVACDHVFALIGADPPKGWIEKLGVAFVMREEEVVTWS